MRILLSIALVLSNMAACGSCADSDPQPPPHAKTQDPDAGLANARQVSTVVPFRIRPAEAPDASSE